MRKATFRWPYLVDSTLAGRRRGNHSGGSACLPRVRIATHASPPAGRRLAFLLLCCLAPGIAGGAEEDFVRLELEGGDRLTGAVLEEDSETVTLRTGFGGVITVPRSAILSLTMAEPPPAEEVAPDAEGQPGISVSGELELGAALVSSIQERRDYLMDFDVTLARGGDRLRLEGLVDVQRAAGEVLRDRQQGTVTLESDLEGAWFASLSGRYLRDPPIGLRRRTSASAQLGRRLVDRDQHRLTVSAGPGFAEERRVDGRSWVTPLAGWTVEYELGLTGLLERFSLRHTQSGSLDPRGRPLRMLLESETGLRYRVTDSLFLGLTGRLDFDSLSPDSTRTLDRRLQLRVGFDW